MAAPTPKNDERRALREAQYERQSEIRRQQASHEGQKGKPVTLPPIEEKIAKAKAVVNSAVKPITTMDDLADEASAISARLKAKHASRKPKGPSNGKVSV